MTYEDYLQHWGILGMKWGQRNGPPYPLSSRQMNREERRLRKNASSMTPEELDAAIARTNKLRELNNANNEFERSQMEAKLIKKSYKEKRLERKIALAENRKKLHNLDHDNTKKNQSLDDQIDELSKKKKLRELKGSSISNGGKFVGAMLATLGTLGISTLVDKLARKWGEGTAEKIYDDILSNNGAKKRAKEEEDRREKLKKEQKEKEDKDKQTRYEKQLAKAIVGAGEMIEKDIDSGKIKKETLTSNEYIRLQQELVNYMMINQGFDKPYKKDK